MQIGSDEQTSHLFYSSLMRNEVVLNEDEFQFLMMFHGVFLAFQNSYSMAEEGTIDSELVDGLTGAILTVKDTPGNEALLAATPHHIAPAIRSLCRRIDAARRRNSNGNLYDSAGAPG